MLEISVFVHKIEYCKSLQNSRRKVHSVPFCLFEGILQ
jgi:hypothetical protein